MDQKKILKEILLNFFVLIKNLNKVIQLSKIFFSGYRSYGVQTHLLFYLNLLHIFLLDNKYTFNIIDAHWIFPAGHLATIYSKTFPKKVVITAHGSDADQRTFENPKITKIVLQTASDANVILTAEKRLYRNLKNHGIKNIILTNQFLDLFPLNFDISKIRNELNLKPDSFIITVGPRLIPELFGIDDFVNAILAIHEKIPELYLVFLGEDNIKNHIKKNLNEKKIMYRITGKICHPKVLDYLKSSDIVCSVGKITQGIFPLEAWACEKPVIGFSDVDEVKITDQENGLLSKMGDIEHLSNNILRLYRDSSLRKQLGKNGRKKIEKDYQKANRIDDILKAYQAI